MNDVSTQAVNTMQMDAIQERNNVQLRGYNPSTLIFVHGFGCNQNIWRLITPAFEARFRVVLVDLVGSEDSDLSAWPRVLSRLYADAIPNAGHLP